MASFNQSPLGQTSLAMAGVSLTLGSAAGSAALQPSTVSFKFDHANNGASVIALVPSMRPSWRRESKIVAGNQ